MYVCNYANGERNCDGCGSCKEVPSYICPVCGEEAYETVFVSNDGEVLGCDNCAQIKEAYDMAVAQAQEREDAKADEEYEAWRDDRLEANNN